MDRVGRRRKWEGLLNRKGLVKCEVIKIRYDVDRKNMLE